MAANGQTNVDIQGMLAALPLFNKALGDTSSAYNGMSEQAQVLEGSWSGDAAQAFIPALNTWLDNCNTVIKQLNIVYEKLEANTGQYEQVHTNTLDSASALKQAMAAGLPGF
jgi:WXG100 family type VII secretion target